MVVTTINENSTRDVVLNFSDHNNDPVTPDEAWYQIIDDDSLEVIVTKKQFYPTSSEHIITIEADENIIINPDNEYEIRTLVITWFYSGTTREENVNFKYRIKNLLGVVKEEFDE